MSLPLIQYDYVKLQNIFAYAALFALATSCHSSLTPVSTKNAVLRQGAGFVFVCRDEPSILLAKRSRDSDAGGTWASLGGTSEPGEEAQDTAVRETTEEAGSMPKIDRILARLRYEKDGFVFVTFIANLSKEEKRRWRPKRNFEHDAIEWFDKLPNNLHPGLETTLKKYVEERAHDV